MAVPNPDCHAFSTWRGVAARREQQERDSPRGDATAKLSKGLLATLPEELARVALGHPIRDTSPLAVVAMGITLRGLRKLRSRLQALFGASYPAMSTADINTLYVQVVTGEYQCRLAELRSEIAAEDVGVPHYFISHAWKNSFDLLMRGIEGFLQSAAEDTRVWVDICAVNQHPSSGFQAADVGAFKDVVQAASGGTLVVMDLSSCNPATRAWCIYEWAATVGCHGPDGLHMPVNTADRATLVNTTDVERAECFNPSDKEAILADVVAQHSSTAAFNNKLKLQLLLEPLSYRVDVRRLMARAASTAWDFGPVDAWLEAGGGGSRVLCVLAGAGEGKSTLSAALCEVEGAQRCRVDAHHFIKYSDQRRREPVRAIKSIAFQLASRYPEVSDRLLYMGTSDVCNLPADDSDEACRVLLGRTLENAVKDKSWGGKQMVVLLDALDEADPPPTAATTSGPSTTSSSGPSTSTAPSDQPPLPVCANKFVMLLCNQLSELPCVRFIVTTRSDALGGGIRAALDQAFKDGGGVDYVAMSELRRAAAATAVASSSSGTSSAEAAAAAGGMLVYHTVAAECFGGGSSDSSSSNSSEQQQGTRDAGAATAAGGAVSEVVVATALPPLSGPPTLEDLYGAYGKLFDTCLAVSSPVEWASLRGLMSVLLAAQEPLPEALLHAMGQGDVLNKLPGYPVTWYVDDHHLYALHKSLADWLGDPHVSGTFAVELGLGHQRLAQHLLAAVRSLATAAGGADAPSSMVSYTPYTLKYLIRHLVECRDMVGLEAVLVDFNFMAAVFSKGHGYGLLRDLLQVTNPTPLLYDMQRWLFARQHELVKAQTAGDVLATALRCPTGTLIFKLAQEAAVAEARKAGSSRMAQVMGGKDERPPLFCLTKTMGLSASWPEHIFNAMGHTNVVRCVDWNPVNTNVMASGCEDGAVKVFSTTTGECIATLQDKQPCINTLAWRPDGRKLAAAGDGQVVKVYDSTSGQCDTVLEGHTEDIRALCWSPDGSALASVSLDLTLSVWDVGSCTRTATVMADTRRGLWFVAWSPDGRTIATGGMDRSIRLWDVQMLGSLTASECADDAIDGPLKPHIELKGHKSRLTGLAWSRDGALFASCSADKTVRLWDPATWQLLGTLQGHTRDVICITFGASSKLLISGGYDSTVRYWDTDTFTQLAVLEGEMAVAFSLSPDGSKLASGTGGRDISMMDVAYALKRPAVKGHTGNVNSVSWHPDGSSRLASAARDRTVRMWDPATCEIIATNDVDHNEEVMCVAFSPDGKLMASCSQRMDMYVHDVVTCKPVCTLASNGHTDLINFLAWHPNSTTLASVSKDKSIRVWELKDMDRVIKSAAVLMGHNADVSAVAYSPSGNALTTGGYDKCIRLWCLPPGADSPQQYECTAVLEGHEGWVSCVAWHQDGIRLASCGCAKADNTRVWSVSSDRRSATCLMSFQYQDGFKYSVAWSPCGKWLASSSYRCVVIWDGADGSLVQVLQGHSQMVMAVAWRPDGRALASGGFDNLLKVYELV